MLFPSTLEQASTQHRLKNVTLCLQTEWAKITVWAEGFPTQIWEEGFAFPGWSSGLGLQLALFAGVLWEISYCRNSHFFFLYRAFFPQWKNSLLSRRAIDVRFANTHLNISSRKFSSVQFSCSVVSDSLRPHGLQHARLPCPSPTPRAYSNSCPLSWLCHPAISSSVVPFSSCLQSSQHQGLFHWISSSHQVAKGLEFQLQHQSFQWIFRTDFL